MALEYVPNAEVIRPRRQIDWVPLVTLGIPTLFVLLFFVMPILLIGRYSFNSVDPVTGLMATDWSFAAYERALTSPIFQKIFLRTLTIALTSTIVGLLVAFPVG